METCNITEAMEILGCSRKHIQKLLRERKLYGRIVERSWRFVKEDLLNYIRKGDTVAAGSSWKTESGNFWRRSLDRMIRHVFRNCLV